MKNIIKSTLVLVAFAITSCSSDSASSGGSNNEPAPVVAMVAEIDGVSFDAPPQIGGNLALNSGGSAFGGSAYFLLKGYKDMNTGKMSARIGNKVYNIYLAIPKNDLSVGIHNFSSAFNSGDYYADLDISGVVPAETVNTTSGFIKVASFDSATRLLKGNFNFTTNDGVDLTTDSHTLIGTFAYVLP